MDVRESALIRLVGASAVGRRPVPGTVKAADRLAPLVLRFGGEFREMPGLRLTAEQAARLFGVEADLALAVLDELRRRSVLSRARDGRYALKDAEADDRHLSERTWQMSPEVVPARVADEPWKGASADRLSCLVRHWTWADEAKGRLERELADGWEYDDAPFADHPFGAYYHWCALLCGLAEAALEEGLLSSSQLAPIRGDIEASLPELRASRQILITIPPALEPQPRIVDLLRSDHGLGRLRRLHAAFGEALRHEQMAREVESLDQ